MDFPSQEEGAQLVVQMLEGAPSAPLMVQEEDSGTTPAHCTRVVLRRVCRLCQIVCVACLDQCDCLDRFSFVVKFGSLIRSLGSLIQTLGSVHVLDH